MDPLVSNTKKINTKTPKKITPKSFVPETKLEPSFEANKGVVQNQNVQTTDQTTDHYTPHRGQNGREYTPPAISWADPIQNSEGNDEDHEEPENIDEQQVSNDSIHDASPVYDPVVSNEEHLDYEQTPRTTRTRGRYQP